MNIIEIVGAFVENQEGKYLLVQEAKPEMYGIWKIPTGRVEPGETSLEAAVREVKQETGYNIRIIRQIAQFKHRGRSGDMLNRTDFHACVTGGETLPQKEEILDINWVDIDVLFELLDIYPPEHPYHKEISDFLEYRTSADYQAPDFSE